MSWPAAKIRRPSLACAALAVALCGCGRPAGPLAFLEDQALVWPAPPEQARIRYLGALSGSDDLSASKSGGEVLAAAFRGPLPPITFASPNAVAVSRGDLLAVSDTSAGAVHIIDLTTREHRLVRGWNDHRTGEGGRFQSPVGVTWVDERLFVADAERRDVVELDAAGSFRRRFGDGELQRPVGIAYAAERERLYVVDGGAHGIVVFDLSGRRVGSFGTRGAGAGQFNFPSHIHCSGDRLLVADSGNFRVQVLDLDGEVRSVFGHKGDAAGDLSLPKGVAADSRGNIYVVDTHFENVQVFDSSGRLLMAFGHEGRGDGEFWLPSGIAIDTSDRIWVSDAGNRRIQVFRFLGGIS